MNSLTYSEIKEMLLEDYSELVENEDFTMEQAIAYMLEDSVRLMKKNNDNYISTIIGLSIIGLKENILTDYLYERLLKIDMNVLKTYEKNDKETLLEDIKYANNCLSENSYELLKDELYKSRVDMLLEK